MYNCYTLYDLTGKPVRFTLSRSYREARSYFDQFYKGKYTIVCNGDKTTAKPVRLKGSELNRVCSQ